jgi:hypothetical protein
MIQINTSKPVINMQRLGFWKALPLLGFLPGCAKSHDAAVISKLSGNEGIRGLTDSLRKNPEEIIHYKRIFSDRRLSMKTYMSASQVIRNACGNGSVVEDILPALEKSILAGKGDRRLFPAYLALDALASGKDSVLREKAEQILFKAHSRLTAKRHGKVGETVKGYISERFGI